MSEAPRAAAAAAFSSAPLAAAISPMSDNPADRAPPQHLQAPLALAVAAPCADLAAAAVQEAAAAVQARLQRLAASRQRAQEAADARSFAADLMVTGGAASTSTPTSSPNRATAATPRLGARGRGRVRLNSLATINSRGRLPSGSSAAGAYYRLPLHRRWLQECSLLPAGLPASLFSPFCWAPRSERCRTGEGATGQPEGGGDTTGTQADEAGIDPIARGRGRGPVGSEVALVWDLRAHSSSRGKKCFIFHRFATRPHQVVQAVTIGGFRCVSKDVVARNPESDEPRTAGSNPAAASQDRQAENENRAVDGSKGSDRNAGSVLGTPEQSVHVYPVEPQPGDVVVAVVRHGLSVPLIGHDVATTVIPELKGMMDPPRAKRGIPSTNTSGRDVVPAQLVMLRPRVVWCTVITLQSVVTLRSPACTDPVDRADFEGNNKPEQSQDDGLTTARFMLVCIMMEELLKTMLQRCTVGRSCNAGVADSIEFVRVDCGCTGKLASTTHAASNPRLHQQAFRVTVKWLRPRRPRDQSKEHLPNGANGDTCTGRNDANDFCGDDSDASTSARSRSAFRTKIVDRLAESIAAYAALLQVPGKMRGVDTVPLVDVSTASNVKAACQPFSRDLLGTVYGWPAEAMDDADPCSPNSADGLPTSQPEAVSSAEGPATGECGISSSAPGRSQIELASEPVAPETLDSLVRRPRSRTEGPEGLALFPGPVAKIVGTKKESYGKSRKYTLELVPPQQKRGTLPMPPPLTFDFYLENLELLRTTVVAQFKHSHHVLPLPRAHSSRGNESKPQGGWGAKLPSSALQRRGSTGTTGNFFRDRHRHQQLLKSGGTKFSSPFSKKDRLVSRIAGIEDFMENECCSRSEVLLSIPFKQFVLHCGVAPGMWETWQAFLKSELAPVAEHFSTASAKRDSQAGSVGGTGSPTNSPPPPRSSLSPDTMEKATSMLIPAPPCTYDVEYPDNLQFTVEAGNMALKHGRMVEVVDAASLQEQHAQSTMRKCTIYDADLRQFEVDVRALRLPGLWHPSPLPSAADVVKVRGTPESVALELGIDINAGSSDAEEFDDSEGSDEGSHGQTQSAEKMRASEINALLLSASLRVVLAMLSLGLDADAEEAAVASGAAAHLRYRTRRASARGGWRARVHPVVTCVPLSANADAGRNPATLFAVRCHVHCRDSQAADDVMMCLGLQRRESGFARRAKLRHLGLRFHRALKLFNGSIEWLQKHEFYIVERWEAAGDFEMGSP